MKKNLALELLSCLPSTFLILIVIIRGLAVFQFRLTHQLPKMTKVLMNYLFIADCKSRNSSTTPIEEIRKFKKSQNKCKNDLTLNNVNQT